MGRGGECRRREWVGEESIGGGEHRGRRVGRGGECRRREWVGEESIGGGESGLGRREWLGEESE